LFKKRLYLCQKYLEMMNLFELKKWRDHIATVPSHLIAMEVWRDGNQSTAECNSVGCIIGHCTALYKLDVLPRVGGDINFLSFSEHFLGVDANDPLWDFLFASDWGLVTDQEDQKEFALLRMDYVLKYGEQPDDWSYNMTFNQLKNMM
jgi:hypothetical protein